MPNQDQNKTPMPMPDPEEVIKAQSVSLKKIPTPRLTAEEKKIRREETRKLKKAFKKN